MPDKDQLLFHPDPTPVADHEAVRAWQSLVGTSARPDRVEVIRKVDGRPWRKSAIYRLIGLPDSFNVVVAKKTTVRNISIERTIYEHVLPELSVATLPYFGNIKDPARDDREWIFMGDAGDTRWDPSNPHETQRATVWLATLHRESSRLNVGDLLPDIDLAHYHEVLESLKNKVGSALSENHHLQNSDATILNNVSRSIETLKGQWHKIEEICTGVPSCVVHTDFTPKNIRVRGNGHSIDLFVLDWDAAGWGLPLEDLWAIDAKAYAYEVEGWWPITTERVKQLSSLGRAMQAIEIMAVHAKGLRSEWPERDMQMLAYYGEQLTDVIQELELK